MAKNSTISTKVEGSTITFTVADAGELTLDMGKLAKEILIRATIHGLVQRVSDGAALSRDAKTGKPASPADKLAAMTAIVEHYESGTNQWRMTGNGQGGSRGSLLLEALMELTPDATREELVTKMKDWTAAQKKAVGLNPKVKVILDRLEAERYASIDTDDLLADL